MPSSLFATGLGGTRGVITTNKSGGVAYRLSDELALAQYATTGTFNATFYAGADEQLDKIKQLAAGCSTEWLAKVAVYAAGAGKMRDMPVFLLAILSTRGEPVTFRRAFSRVIRPGNGRSLRTFVQMMRSGQAGRKGLGTMVKRAIQEWFDLTSLENILSASVGGTPSIADIIKMVHPSPGHGPSPTSAARSALYAMLIGKEFDAEILPGPIRDYALFKRHRAGKLPNVRFELVTGLARDERDWKDIALASTWNQLRQNINTFQQHNVFSEAGLTRTLAARLADADLVARAHVLPYSLLAAHTYMGAEAPQEMRQAMLSAANAAMVNVPQLPGRTIVCVDLSGSMDSPVTGRRDGSTTKVACRDAAALIAVSLAQRNENCDVVGFTTEAKYIRGLGGDVLEVSQKLSGAMSGGTDCASPLRLIAKDVGDVDTVVMVSDNESWFNDYGHAGPSTQNAWLALKLQHPRARLVCIDLQPSWTAQALDADDVFNVGGMSDAVFDIIRAVADGEILDAHWQKAIDSVVL